MFEAILFDLDGTLLNIDMEYFLTHYFRSMGSLAVSEQVLDPNQLIAQILRSTEVMINDLDPEASNEDVFMRDFLTSTKADEVVMREFFNKFYDHVFPDLQIYCEPFMGIQEMMAKIFASNTKVVIATNSVFPLKAIQTRLNWAGIGQFPYTMVTSYENMHFCKPHTQYYEEIVKLIGVNPATCLMVGNDADEDLAASKLGMKTFLVTDRLITKGGNDYQPDWKGDLQDLFAFLNNFVYKN